MTRAILCPLVDCFVDGLLGIMGANEDLPSTIPFLELNMLKKRKEKKTIDHGIFHRFFFMDELT